MRIRSITTFTHPRWPVNRLALQKVGIFAQQAQDAYCKAGYDVQTLRLATPPFPTYLQPQDYVDAVTALEVLAHSEGFEYISLGPASPGEDAAFTAIPEMLANSGILFVSGILTTPDGKVSLPAIHACAKIIHKSTALEKNGFANLRFAALANVLTLGAIFPRSLSSGEATGLRIGP